MRHSQGKNYPRRFKSCPRVGGISNVRPLCRPLLEFQVVPPCGGHHMTDFEKVYNFEVSSRAPVWGASEVRHKILWPIHGFKSCPRVGGIRPVDYYRLHRATFQVVPPCGGHPRCCCSTPPKCCFKSCPRVGGIAGATGEVAGAEVSSRAPVWGASRGKHRGALVGKVSSRAPVWGASMGKGVKVVKTWVSSRAPVWGASFSARGQAPT